MIGVNPGDWSCYIGYKHKTNNLNPKTHSKGDTDFLLK